MRGLLRHWRAGAVLALVVAPSVLLVLLAAFDPRDLMTDGGADGPLLVRGGTVLPDRVDGVPAGQVLGWRSTVCLKPDAVMLARIEFRDAGGRVVEARTRRWEAGQRPCGALPGMMRVPRDTLPGSYALCRVAVLRPDGWLPLRVVLGCLPVDVLPPAD